MECVAVCPSEGALHLALPRWARSPNEGHLPSWAIAVGIALLFFGIVGYAKTAGHWNGDVPDSAYRQLVPQGNDVNHPAEYTRTGANMIAPLVKTNSAGLTNTA